METEDNAKMLMRYYLMVKMAIMKNISISQEICCLMLEFPSSPEAIRACLCNNAASVKENDERVLS